MVNKADISIVGKLGSRIAEEMKRPDAGTQRRLWDLYEYGSEDQRAALVAAMIGHMLVAHYRGHAEEAARGDTAPP